MDSLDHLTGRLNNHLDLSPRKVPHPAQNWFLVGPRQRIHLALHPGPTAHPLHPAPELETNCDSLCIFHSLIIDSDPRFGQVRSPMYAVIETGGKQYRVAPGDLIQVEKLEGDKGSKIKFDKILFASKGAADSAQIWLGKPYLNGAAVEAEVLAQGRGEKVLIVKMKRRKQYRRTQGHRQELTQLLITQVSNGAGETATLSDADKSAKLAKFINPLKVKGLAHTPKTVGSRKRLSAAVKAKAAAPKKTAAKTKKAAK